MIESNNFQLSPIEKELSIILVKKRINVHKELGNAQGKCLN